MPTAARGQVREKQEGKGCLRPPPHRNWAFSPLHTPPALAASGLATCGHTCPFSLDCESCG